MQEVITVLMARRKKYPCTRCAVLITRNNVNQLQSFPLSVSSIVVVVAKPFFLSFPGYSFHAKILQK
jgi:hypothetical protein